LVVWATYDADDAPNSQNAIIESNLPAGVTPPAGAVTDLEWYQLGVGLTVHIGVDAATGALNTKRVLVTTTDARDDRGVPMTAALYQNIPNRVYDVRGALVRVLEDRIRAMGRYEVDWNGDDGRGERVASGVYFYRLTTPGYSQTRKMVLLK
jgi:hypothetical protein